VEVRDRKGWKSETGLEMSMPFLPWTLTHRLKLKSVITVFTLVKLPPLW
jgi:hypothetical protein